jgi:transposase
MMGKPKQREGQLFHVGFILEERIPAEHVLRQIDRVVDFSFVRSVVAPRYGRNGHESLDPALVLRLLFLCFFENVRSERELMRQLPLRLDWLWFCRMGLDDEAPDHSVLSKARRRWGEDVFEQLFKHVLGLCQEAGLVEGKTSHADSTLLKANASLEGRVSRALWEQLEKSSGEPGNINRDDIDNSDSGDPNSKGSDPAGGDAGATEPRPMKLNELLVSPVDPDAATSTRKAGGTTLGYRDHRLVDDKHGVILATLATAADKDDGAMLGELLSRQLDYTRNLPEEAVGDSMYGTRENYRDLKEDGIKPYLKKRRGKDSPRISWLKQFPAECSQTRALYLLGRRKSRAEGSFAEAHVRMNHRRCRWRRRWRVQMQCYMVAMVQNAKKLARYGHRPKPRRAVGMALFIDLEKWKQRIIGHQRCPAF